MRMSAVRFRAVASRISTGFKILNCRVPDRPVSRPFDSTDLLEARVLIHVYIPLCARFRQTTIQISFLQRSRLVQGRPVQVFFVHGFFDFSYVVLSLLDSWNHVSCLYHPLCPSVVSSKR
jgi:hypothetical protein